MLKADGKEINTKQGVEDTEERTIGHESSQRPPEPESG